MATSPLSITPATILAADAYVSFEAIFDDDIDGLSAREVVELWQALRGFLWDAIISDVPDDMAAEYRALGLDSTAILLNDIEIGSVKFKGFLLWALATISTPVVAEAVKQSETGQTASKVLSHYIDTYAAATVAIGKDVYREIYPALERHARKGDNYQGFQVTKCELTDGGMSLTIRRYAPFRPGRGGFQL